MAAPARAAQGRFDRLTTTQVEVSRFSLAGSEFPSEVQEENPIRLDHLTHQALELEEEPGL